MYVIKLNLNYINDFGQFTNFVLFNFYYRLYFFFLIKFVILVLFSAYNLIKFKPFIPF